MSKKVFLRTFGCQMNERDSEIIQGMLLDKGFIFVDDIEKAELVLFNTCSVRQHAEDRVVGNLQRLAHRKKTEPNLKVGVLGCMSERHGKMLGKEFPQVDIVAGPSNIYKIPEMVEKLYAEVDSPSLFPETILAVGDKKRPKKGALPEYRSGGLSGFVNIVYGCNNYCSYCIVPYVRGREVSRPMKDIVKEVKKMVDQGFKEVTLLGQNVNSYGKGQTQKVNFPDLLAAVNKVKGLERIRFTSSHPKDATKRLFRAMRDLDKVCEHIHLPLQSGSNKMLDLMNRKYTYEEYKEKIIAYKELVPAGAISSDFIVGFPSEKKTDYNATYKAIEEIRFNSSFIFKYSPRPPALASCLVDDVTDEEKSERNQELLALQKKISHSINKDMIGTQQEVLVESKSKRSDEQMIGRIRNNTSCVFDGDEKMIGSIVNVKITGTSPFTLKGRIES